MKRPFLVRQKDSQTYAVSIGLRSKFVHHLLHRGRKGKWVFNEHPIPAKGSLRSVVQWLCKAHPEDGWEVPLGTPLNRADINLKAHTEA